MGLAVTISKDGFVSLETARLVEALEGSVEQQVNGQAMGGSFGLTLPTHLDTPLSVEVSLRTAGVDERARRLRRSNPERWRSNQE